MHKYVWTVIALLFASGCSQHITSPSVAATPLLCVSGQSNAYYLLPYLVTGASTMTYGSAGPGIVTLGLSSQNVQGWAAGAQGIRYWDEGANGWRETSPYLTPACSKFVWFQGETDDINGISAATYVSAEVDLFQRIRARTNSTLQIAVVQIAPRFTTIRKAQSEACRLIGGCTYISTDDLAFPDGIHMDEPSYRSLTQRLH